MKAAAPTLMIGQSGGPTATLNATLAGVLRAAAAHPGIGRILGMRHGIEGALRGDFVDLSDLPKERIDRLVVTPGAALGSCRYKVREQDYERLLDLFREHGVGYFFYIGGNDSMDTCHKVARLAEANNLDLRVVGLPKTIDNDLARTDHTPGFGSAARYVALATRDAGKDLEAMATFDDVSILEVMGRNAGWLAAASVLGKRSPDDPPHLVYLPERVFDIERFLEDVRREHRARGHVFIVVSEGVRLADGTLIGALDGVKKDQFGHQLVTLSAGAGQYLARLISERLGLQARANRPGTLQRSCGSTLSRTDADEAVRLGEEAVKLATAGGTDVMMTLERVSDSPYRCEVGSAPLAEVANAERLMPDKYIGADGTSIDESFFDYALPLIGGELPPYERL